MGQIVSNERLSHDIYRMTVAGTYAAQMGQFYMLRCDDGYHGDRYPLLSRPISIHDRNEREITFLYRVHGRGTALLAELDAGQRVLLEGPFGNGFPSLEQPGRIALVGGGMGVAPLLPVLQNYRDADVFLGYTGEPFAVDYYRQAAATAQQVQVMSHTTRSILERIQPDRYDTIMACGPVGMLKALADMCTDQQLYISIEKRMACGIGACLGCTVRTAAGNRRTCQEGPVFPVEEVLWHELASL